MIERIWYFKNNKEIYNVLYDDNRMILVQNKKGKYYSFGLTRDFGTIYGFPVNQSCLTKEKCIDLLERFIEIDKKYNDANKTMQIYKNMITILKGASEKNETKI